MSIDNQNKPKDRKIESSKIPDAKVEEILKMEDDPQFNQVLQEESLSWLKTQNKEYFNREFTGALDEKGYLIGKEGDSSTKPFQNIGGGKPMLEVLDRAKNRFAKEFSQLATKYPETKLLAEKQKLSENKEQLEQSIEKDTTDLKKALKKLGIPESVSEKAPSVLMARESFAEVDRKLTKTEEDLEQEKNQGELMESFLEREYGETKSPIERIIEENPGGEIKKHIADEPEDRNLNLKGEIADKIDRANQKNQLTEEQEQTLGKETIGGSEQAMKKEKESEDSIIRDVEQGSGKTTMGFQREDVSGIIQKTRGKENVRYTSPDGKKFFAKYVNQQEKGRDNIAGIKKEKEILDLLADSGVTPRISELKIYPNEKRARLNIEQLSGKSLDKFGDAQGEEFLKENAEEIINSTAKALNKIHQKKILLVDVNEGSFLVDKKDNTILANVVDFELALNLEKQSVAEKEAAFDWYASKDIGIRLPEGIDHQDIEIFKKAEITLWARTLAERILGFSQVLDWVALSAEKQKEFDEMAEKIRPSLIEKIAERAKRSYEYEARTPKEERYFDLPTEEEFIAKEVRNELPQKINAELLGITLEEKIKASNIKLSKETIDFMSRALSLELKNRPVSFDEYLK